MPVRIYTAAEVDGIAAAGSLVADALASISHTLRPGETTREVAERTGAFVRERGGRPAFHGHRDGAGPPFPGRACVCVNEEAANAVPSDRLLREGDLVTLDLGIELDGWFADAATTAVVGGRDAFEAGRLSAAGREILRSAVHAIGPGRAWSEVAAAARDAARRAGVSLVPGLDGHGIGRALHEMPACPLVPGSGFRDFVLWAGMVLAIEPVVADRGEPLDLVGLDDGWTLVTRTGAPVAGEERTVVVTTAGHRVLTPIGV